MKVIVGLGNPGNKYENTRHNLGAIVLEDLARDFNLGFKNQPAFKAKTALGDFEDEKIALFIPQTFMNLSGEAVGSFLNFYKLNPSSLLVLHDELDIELGQMKFSRGSSSAGHRGIESLIQILGTHQFDRLRLGIGRPSSGRSGADYVLERFGTSEQDQVAEVVKLATEAVKCSLKQGVEAAMNRFHRKSTLLPET